jgi:GxxExxY protein
MTENELAKIVVDVAYHIHRTLGPGLLESVYHTVMVYELRKRGLQVTSKEPVPIIWDDVRLEKAFEADIVVEGKLIVELKSIEDVPRVLKKQLLTHLRLTNRH